MIALTSAKRSRALPDVPRDIVNKLAQAWKAGAATQPALSAFEHIGADIKVSSPADFADFIRTENNRWGSLIRRLGIKID